MKVQFSEENILAILKEAETDVKTAECCRKNLTTQADCS